MTIRIAVMAKLRTTAAVAVDLVVLTVRDGRARGARSSRRGIDAVPRAAGRCPADSCAPTRTSTTAAERELRGGDRAAVDLAGHLEQLGHVRRPPTATRAAGW